MRRQQDASRLTAWALVVVFLVVLAASLWLVPAHAARKHGSPAYLKAKRIVFSVFPNATQARALRVVGCETGYTYEPWARNRSSGAYGLFQFIPGNHGRVIRWGASSMRVDYYRMGNPWYASTAALILSRGGTDWSEWACRP